MSTVELLESIILYLPCRQTLVVRRVSRLWRDTFAGSHTLQVALCLMPVDFSIAHSFDVTSELGAARIEEVVDGYVENMICSGGKSGPGPLAFPPCAMAAHAHIKNEYEHGKTTSNPILSDVFCTYLENKAAWMTCSIQRFRQMVKPECPIWARMSLIQPPAHEIFVYISRQTTTREYSEDDRDEAEDDAWQKGFTTWQQNGMEPHTLDVFRCIKLESHKYLTIADLMQPLIEADAIWLEADKTSFMIIGIVNIPPSMPCEGCSSSVRAEEAP